MWTVAEVLLGDCHLGRNTDHVSEARTPQQEIVSMPMFESSWKLNSRVGYPKAAF
jgi:hypothetical protein